MVSVLSRLSEASATCLMCAGRLSRPALLAAFRIDIETELGCDRDLRADGGQSFAHQFLVGERAVDFGGVEEGYAAFDGRSDQRDPRLFIDGRTVAEAQAHASESDRRDFEVGFSKFALFHIFLRLVQMFFSALSCGSSRAMVGDSPAADLRVRTISANMRASIAMGREAAALRAATGTIMRPAIRPGIGRR
jgi:hypothetical protein